MYTLPIKNLLLCVCWGLAGVSKELHEILCQKIPGCGQTRDQYEGDAGLAPTKKITVQYNMIKPPIAGCCNHDEGMMGSTNLQNPVGRHLTCCLQTTESWAWSTLANLWRKCHSWQRIHRICHASRQNLRPIKSNFGDGCQKKQFRFSHSKFLRLAKAIWQVPFNFCGKVHHRSWGDGIHGYSHPSPSSRLVQWKCFLIWESMNLKKCSWFEVKLFLIVRYISLIRHAMACACMRIWGVTQLGWERYAYALSASINLCGFGCNCPWSTCHATHADVAQKRSTRACVARDTCMLLFETAGMYACYLMTWLWNAIFDMWVCLMRYFSMDQVTTRRLLWFHESLKMCSRTVNSYRS